jgi:hypothetical protein
MAHEVTFAVGGHAVAQDEVVHAAADIDRIDLDVAVVGEGRADVGAGFIHHKRPTLETSGGEKGDVKWGGQHAGREFLGMIREKSEENH